MADKKQIVDGFDRLTINPEFIEWVEKLSAAQEYRKQLLAQKSKLKKLFDSVLHKSMKGRA